MSCCNVNVGRVGVVGHFRCRSSHRMRSDGLSGGFPSSVFVAARDNAVQLKDLHTGGTVNGVP